MIRRYPITAATAAGFTALNILLILAVGWTWTP